MSTIIEFPTPSDAARIAPTAEITATLRRRRPHFMRVRVATGRDLVMLRGLFAEQRQWLASLGVPVEHLDPDAESEYADPPAYYTSRGTLLFASRGWTGLGMIALRDMGDGDVELRRMYVSPWARGTGAGSALLDAAIETAHRSGYGRIVLETLPDVMDNATRMYRDRGFAEIDLFHVDHPHAIAMELRLERTS